MTATATLGAQVTILYPKPLSIKDHRPLYPLRLLQLALSKLDKPYVLKPSKVQMTQSRALRMVGTQKAADVIWTMSTEEREQNYIPIRIPIYKGLIGWHNSCFIRVYFFTWVKHYGTSLFDIDQLFISQYCAESCIYFF